jgi:hypothetical protein
MELQFLVNSYRRANCSLQSLPPLLRRLVWWWPQCFKLVFKWWISLRIIRKIHWMTQYYLYSSNFDEKTWIVICTAKFPQYACHSSVSIPNIPYSQIHMVIESERETPLTTAAQVRFSSLKFYWESSATSLLSVYQKRSLM